MTAADRSLPGGGDRGRGGRGRPGGRRCASWPRRWPPTRQRWPRGAAGGRAAGHRADRPRLGHPDRAGVRGLRPHRTAAVPVPAAGCASGAAARQLAGPAPLRRGQAGRRPRRDGQPVCEACRRRDARHAAALRDMRQDHLDRGPRPRRQPDICVNCYRLPEATCHVRAVAALHLRRTSQPSANRAPRGPPLPAPAAATTAHRRPAGPRTRLRSVLHHRAAPPAAVHRLRAPAAAGHPARPGRHTCADCAGIPVTHACADCGLEDKLYETGRCDALQPAPPRRRLLPGDPRGQSRRS